MQHWRTSIGPETAAAFGVTGDLHVVLFQPRDDVGGLRRAVAVSIPETKGPLLAELMRGAGTLKARVIFVCDTRGQADDIAAQAARLLPGHRRVPYERAVAGDWGARQ